MRAALTILYLGLAVPGLLNAQVNITTPCASKPKMMPDGKVRMTDCTGKAVVEDPGAALPAAKPSSAPVSPASASTTTVSRKLSQAYEDYAVANLQYEQQQLTRNAAVFAWQDTSSKIIFVLVTLIVTTGLLLSGLQFRTASQIDLSAGKDGLHLKTSIVGVVILAMSMLFLYLYLFFVYPIKEIAQPGS